MSSTLDAWHELREKIRLIPISSIAGKYISLVKKGANYESLCPFHKDTHPSLKINDQKNLFKCFACGIAGDSIKFLMELKKLTFKEAVEVIAHDFNLSLPTPQIKKQQPKIKAYLDCHEEVLKFYQRVTRENYQAEIDLFCKERKISLETIQQFKICFAPEGKQLAEYFLKLKSEKNLSYFDTALELGLIKKGENGYFDTFRRRIMFPICNSLGQVIAFGSRATVEGQMPKYLNSQESLIFNKRQTLYGLSLARPKIREHGNVFVVEGYMDAIMMHQIGMQNTVAVMGVALTEEHLRELGQNIKTMYMMFDQDQAGLTASKRALPLLLNKKIPTLRIDLLDAKDPDEFVKKYGQLKFNEQVEKATPWIDYLLDQISKTDTGANVDAKLTLLQQAFEYLRPLGKELIACERAINIAKKLGLNSPEATIIERYNSFIDQKPSDFSTNSSIKSLKQNLEEAKVEQTKEITTEAPKIQSIELPVTPKEAKPNKSELYLLKHILQNPELLKLNNFTEVLEFVNNRQVKDLLQFLPKIMQEVDIGDFAQTVISLIDDRAYDQEIKQLVCDVFFNWQPPMTMEESLLRKQFLDLRKKILIENLRMEKAILKEEHTVLTKQEEITELLKKLHILDKKIFELKATSDLNAELPKKG